MASTSDNVRSPMDAKVRAQMAAMGIDIENLKGEPLNPKIPMSRRYSSQVRKEIVHDMGDHMFHLVEDIPFPHERVVESKGRDNCMHCNRPIMGRIFFVPYEMTENDFKNERGETGAVYICFPDPYCRPECALASMPDNFRGKAEFFMMYGPQVQAAPPRSCLYGMGKIGIEEFHARIDSGTVWTRDNEIIHYKLAPIYYSSVPGEARKITDDANAISACMSNFTARDMDTGGESDKVYTIVPRSVNEGYMGSVFKTVQ